MANHPAAGHRVLYTIGHSNHTLEVFVDLLQQHDIRQVVDVRSSPYSRHATHFNKEALENHLSVAGLSYRFAGHALGGRPQDPQYYDRQGYVLYDRIARAPTFQQELSRLTAQAVAARTALLCGEEDPSECHRRLLIGRVVIAEGFELLHLRGDGRAQSETELIELENHQKTGGQLTMFDLDGDKPWRSTRSVSREHRPA